MFNDNTVQGVILNTLENEGKPFHLFTTNGFRVNGKIVASDQYTILMEDGDDQNLVYKHAISTIALPKGRKFRFDRMAAEKAAAEE